MVLPDGTGAESSRRRTGRRALFLTALVAVVVGLFGLGALTSPDPEAIAPSTTTSSSTTTTTLEAIEPPIDIENFSVSQIITGEQFEWDLVRGFDDVFPHSLVAHDGYVYLFASTAAMWSEGPQGLRAWRSPNGLDWEPLGAVIDDDMLIGNVTATPQGLVVFEMDDDPVVAVWRSDDGLNWSRSEITAEGQDGAPVIVWPMAVGGNEDILLLSTEMQLDVSALVEDSLHELGFDIDPEDFYGWNPQSSSEGLEIVVNGPFGLPALLIPADDLKLTEEEESWIFRPSGNPYEQSIWLSEEGSEWERRQLGEPAWIQSIVPAPGGGVLAFGYGNVSNSAWYSADGNRWTPRSGVPQPVTAIEWRGGLVGITEGSRPELLVSTDGVVWEETGLDNYFPLPISWYQQGLTAGDGGVAVLVNGWRDDSISQEPERAMVELKRDGVTLTLDLHQGAIQIDSGDTRHTWTMWTSTKQEGLDVDLENELVTFFDRDTGDPLTSFTFDELTKAEMGFWDSQYVAEGNEYRALAFSADAETWSIQDPGASFGPGMAISHLAVTRDRVVALVADYETVRSGDGGFEVWTAEIP